MSVIATAVRHLLAAGVTGDALVEAVAEIEAELGTAPKPRSAGAIRQERYRENLRNKASQVTDGDVCDVSDASPPLSRPPSPSPQTPQPHPPTHTPPDNTTPRTREADPFPKPEWTTDQVWRDLRSNRKAKRLPCTATAHAKLLRDLDRLSDDEWPPGRLLEAIVARGWAAAYDPRDETSPNDRQRQHPSVSRLSTRQIGERIAADLARGRDGAANGVPRLGAAGGNDRQRR